MSKSTLDIDEDLFVEAADALGTSTAQDTVDRALRLAVEESRARRRRALTALQEIADDGGFDFDRLVPRLRQERISQR